MDKRLDAITSEDVQELKTEPHEKAPKTVNNVLTVLNTLLKKGVEWDVITRMPGTVRLLPIPSGLCIQRSEWKGHVTATKGGRLRYVPMTVRLAAPLRGHRHLHRARVLCQRDGLPLTQKIVQDHVRRSVRGARLAEGGVHRLRHTFCSHLAMRGAPARAIQDLAGHMNLNTTQRCMHLSPAAIEAAIRLLDRGGRHWGDAGS